MTRLKCTEDISVKKSPEGIVYSYDGTRSTRRSGASNPGKIRSEIVYKKLMTNDITHTCVLIS